MGGNGGKHRGGKSRRDRRATFSAPAVPGSEGIARQYVYLPQDRKQEELLKSREALYGRFTYYSGETPVNNPTYPASGITPVRIASIYTEVVTQGRVLAKADMDEQVMRRDTHLRGTDRGIRVAITGKQVMSQPANESDLARDLAYLAMAMIDDVDGFDGACKRILKSHACGYGAGEAVFAPKALRIAGTNISIPGAWPQQIDEIKNRNFRFEPVKNQPMLNQSDGKCVPITKAPHKIIFHEDASDGESRLGGHLTCTIWPHMIKHDGIARLAQCLDFYGIPHPYAELPWDMWQNEELKQATREAMADFGSGNPYIKVKEVLWGFTQLPQGLDARGMHGLLWGLCNTEQSKAVQGETLTTELGGVGSYNASETHEAVKADVVSDIERGLASTIRKWIRACFVLNMPALCAAFKATPAQILGSVPRVFWLIHRAMNPEVRQRMRFAAVAAGLPIDMEQEYRENGWAKPTQPSRAIRGENVVVSDGARSVGSLEAAHGVDNPKDMPPASSPTQGDSGGAQTKVELTPSAQSAVIKVNEGREMLSLPPVPGGDDRFISQASADAERAASGAISQKGAMAALSALASLQPVTRNKA